MKKDIAITVKSWNKQAKSWLHGTPPARPNIQDIAYLKEQVKNKLKKVKKVKILVLGSTPEIRDMLSGFGAKVSVVCVDMSFDMIMSMTQVMKNTSKNEIWMRSNWIDSPLKEKYFDLIFGDAVLHNIHKKEQSVFLQHLVDLLKKDGQLVSRIVVHNNNVTSKVKDPDTIFKRFLEWPKNPWAATELIVTLFFVTTKDGNMSSAKIKKFIDKYYNAKTSDYRTGNKKIDNWFDNPFDKGWLDTPKVFTVWNKSKTDTLLKKYFKIDDIFNSELLKKHPIHEFAGDCFPTYTLTPKI